MAISKKFVKMRNDKRAEMGVGTMIIFIAMVLVAAVAASVLISTANTVREQAQSTGDQAINNVASGFIVHDVVGTVSSGHTEITDITIYLRLAAGSPRINMANVMVTLVSGDVNQVMSMYGGDSLEAWVNTPVAHTDATPTKAECAREASTGYLTNAAGTAYYYYLDATTSSYKHISLTAAQWAALADGSFAAGAGNAVTVTIGGTGYAMLVEGAAQNTAVLTSYFAERTQAADTSIPWSNANYVVAQGDLIALHVMVEGAKTIGFSQAGVIKIMPAYGQMCLIDFVTPESYSTGFVTLA